MCGRFSLIVSADQLRERFGVSLNEPLKSRYNIAPTQNIPIITNLKPREITLARWGMIPHWAKDEKSSYSMINAKAETIEEKPTYKGPFKSKRCLIPADGFYEWKKTGTKKVPFRFTRKDGKLFAFAGLFDEWEKEGKQVISCTIITTNANPLLAKVHDRMPVILDEKQEKAWLSETSADNLKGMLKPYPSDQMASVQISDKINSPKNDSKDLLSAVKPIASF
jgi:putative SOS response-associated peptidase YedK